VVVEAFRPSTEQHHVEDVPVTVREGQPHGESDGEYED
jgi:hypothetical protein